MLDTLTLVGYDASTASTNAFTNGMIFVLYTFAPIDLLRSMTMTMPVPWHERELEDNVLPRGGGNGIARLSAAHRTNSSNGHTPCLIVFLPLSRKIIECAGAGVSVMDGVQRRVQVGGQRAAVSSEISMRKRCGVRACAHRERCALGAGAAAHTHARGEWPLPSLIPLWNKCPVLQLRFLHMSDKCLAGFQT